MCSQIYGYAKSQSEDNLMYLQQIILCLFVGVQPFVQIRASNMHFVSLWDFPLSDPPYTITTTATELSRISYGQSVPLRKKLIVRVATLELQMAFQSHNNFNLFHKHITLLL